MVINPEEDSWACRALDARLRNGASPRKDSEPWQVCEHRRNGIGAGIASPAADL